jgi:hypothetical protein
LVGHTLSRLYEVAQTPWGGIGPGQSHFSFWYYLSRHERLRKGKHDLSPVNIRGSGRRPDADRSEYSSHRPGFGMAPKEFANVLGRRAACDIARGTLLIPGLLVSPAEERKGFGQ